MLTGRANEPNARINDLIRNLDILQIHSCKIYSRCILKKMILRSVKYTRPKKTDDTVIQLKSEKILQIHDFVVVDNTCYLYGRELVVAPAEFCTARLNHIYEVIDKQGGEIFVNANDLEKKIVFFSTGTKSYISFLPDHLGT